MCCEYALAFRDAAGGSVNVHLLVCSCHDFLFSLCIWKSCSPFVFVFYCVAKFMQEITASIKSIPVRCRKGCSMMKYERFIKKKKKSFYHENWSFFQHIVPLIVVGVSIRMYSLVSQMWLHSAKNCVLAECT